MTTQKSIDKAASKINATPMKCLGFNPPLRFLPNAALLRLPVESGHFFIALKKEFYPPPALKNSPLPACQDG
ncbi:MAG: hypothetical protein LBP20_08905 [Treponema sp.]|nr:hypothetical protein [Treponema sp.]